MIRILKTLWRDHASTYEGEFFKFKDAFCYPKPARPGGVPIFVGGESKAAMQRVAQLADGWLPYNLPVEKASAAIGELKDLTRAAGRNPESLRICKIVYETATLDDLKRYRDAGVTEFNLATNGDIPVEDAGMEAKFREWKETLVGQIAEL